MASWLPETLFEIVGQGPAPSKDYYQLLITRTQASASHGFLSLLTPFPARPGLAMRPAPGKQPPWPAGSAASQLTARDLPSSPLLGGLRVGSLPRPARHWRAFLASPNPMPTASLPTSRLPTRCVPSARQRKTGVPACVPPHLSVGRRERKTQPSVPRRSRQGEKGTVSSRVGLNPGGFFFLRTSRWPLQSPHQNSSF